MELKAAGTEDQERQVKEFMKKKEEELKHSCLVDKNPEGIYVCGGHRTRK